MKLCRSLADQRCCATPRCKGRCLRAACILSLSNHLWLQASTYGGCGNISCQNHILVWCSRMCRTTQATGLTQHQRSALWNFQIGSTLSPSIRRPAGHSPAHSQSSLPSHATNGHQFYPSLGQGPGDSTAARPQGWIALYRVALSLVRTRHPHINFALMNVWHMLNVVESFASGCCISMELVQAACLYSS